MEGRGNRCALGRVFIAVGCHGRALERGDSDGFHRGDRGKNQGGLGHGRGLLAGGLGTARYGAQSGMAIDGRGGVGAVNSRGRRGGHRRDLAMQATRRRQVAQC